MKQVYDGQTPAPPATCAAPKGRKGRQKVRERN